MSTMGLSGFQGQLTSSFPYLDSPAREIPWYVIHTCCHHEAKVEARLSQRGLDIFLPRIIAFSRRRDRKALISVPLFPGYLFVHDALEGSTYWDIIKIPGVVRILGNKGRFETVPAETIESIKLAVASDRPYHPAPYLKRGQRVRVCDGPLMGVIGIIISKKEKKRKVVVNVELFRRAVAVELSDEAVEPWYGH